MKSKVELRKAIAMAWKGKLIEAKELFEGVLISED